MSRSSNTSSTSSALIFIFLLLVLLLSSSSSATAVEEEESSPISGVNNNGTQTETHRHPIPQEMSTSMARQKKLMKNIPHWENFVLRGGLRGMTEFRVGCVCRSQLEAAGDDEELKRAILLNSTRPYVPGMIPIPRLKNPEIIVIPWNKSN